MSGGLLFSLRELLNDSFKFVEIKNQKCELSDSDSPQKALLVDCPPNLAVIRIPKQVQGRIFADVKDKGIMRTCDFLLLVPHDASDRIQAVFCEITETVDGAKTQQGKEVQIYSTLPLLPFILSGLKWHYGEDLQPECSYVILCGKHSRPSKWTVHPTRSPKAHKFRTLHISVMASGREGVSLLDLLK